MREGKRRGTALLGLFGKKSSHAQVSTESPLVSLITVPPSQFAVILAHQPDGEKKKKKKKSLPFLFHSSSPSDEDSQAGANAGSGLGSIGEGTAPTVV